MVQMGCWGEWEGGWNLGTTDEGERGERGERMLKLNGIDRIYMYKRLNGFFLREK